MNGGMVKVNDMKVKYGVEYIARPYIKATEKIDLTGETGKEIIKVETEKVLRVHKKTFERLSQM